MAGGGCAEEAAFILFTCLFSLYIRRGVVCSKLKMSFFVVPFLRFASRVGRKLIHRCLHLLMTLAPISFLVPSRVMHSTQAPSDEGARVITRVQPHVVDLV